MQQMDEDDAFAAAVPLSQRALGARAERNSARYMNDLNTAQREAVEALDGPVLMLAGAGTGKTKALMARVAHLIETGRAQSHEILAVTFTNKAAREMKDRLAATPFELREPVRWMGTFHSLSVKILRRHAELIVGGPSSVVPNEPKLLEPHENAVMADLGALQGLPGGSRIVYPSTDRVHLKPNFTILDTDDQLRLLKQLIAAANIDEKRWPARMLASMIDSWKNRALTPDRVPASEASAYNNRGTELYEQYQQRLLTLNATDFGDLLLHCVVIFQKHPDVLEQYQRWFKYILVDEYQDTNVAQYLWLRLLAQSHRNICCVGDDDQSIYGWRGAEVGNILRFEKDFPGAKVVRLEQNYRSTAHILAAASGIISANAGRLGKTLWTAGEAGERVRLIGHWDGEEEARWIGEEVEGLNSGSHRSAINRFNLRSMLTHNELLQLAEQGLGRATRHEFVKYAFRTRKAYTNPRVASLVTQLLNKEGNSSSKFRSMWDSPLDRFNLNEIAILVRASHQMRAFEDRFLTIGLPYRVIGGPRFYERQEVRDAMGYFRLAVSPEDDLAFERVVNLPKRGLGDKAQAEIQREARATGVSLLDGARSLLARGGIGGKGAGQLRAFCDGVERWHTAVLGARPDLPDDTLIEPLLPQTAPFHADNHVRLAEVILEESGYISMWQNDKTPEAPGRLENLKELVKALEQFDSLQGFLEHVSLIMENDSEEAAEKVSIMTLHAAKGLEFPVVFLPGWEDGLFPSQRSMDESGLKGLEEERRLAYVGITRAEELCTISFASNRRVYGQWQSQLPSRFIDELPAKHVEVLTPPSLHRGGYGAAAPSFGAALEDRAVKADVYNSPGWKRMQDRATARPVSQPREARNVTIDAQAVSSYVTGDRVFHQKFGYGEIIAIEGDKLAIEFDHAGSKMIVARWVVPAHQVDDVPF